VPTYEYKSLEFKSKVFVHAMKALWEVEVKLNSFLDSALYGSELSVSRPDRFISKESSLCNILSLISLRGLLEHSKYFGAESRQ
jgi:hypothetical protein